MAIHADAVDFWHVAISDAGLPDRLLANAVTTRKEKHQSVHNGPRHRVACHRVSRGSNFGQLVSGFNSSRSAGRSG
jgi:hypothetical protein